jgi:hypothetical protein
MKDHELVRLLQGGVNVEDEQDRARSVARTALSDLRRSWRTCDGSVSDASAACTELREMAVE